MLRIYTLLTLSVATILLATSAATAEDWPGWRGPRSDGTSLETDVPTHWSGTKNIVWKKPIPGQGHSSPIVSSGRIFLTTAIDVDQSKARELLCFDRTSGKLLWQRTVFRAKAERMHGENSCASATPTTDGQTVYVTFLDGRDVVVAAYDFDGRRRWLVRPGKFASQWGFCHSPVLFGDKLLVAACGSSLGFVAALDPRDGSTLWQVIPDRFVQAFASPFVRRMAGRDQCIVLAGSQITSYAPADGAVLWTVDGPSKEYTATPVFHEKAGLLLCVSSWPKRVLTAIRPDGQGNVTDENIAWQTKDGGPYVPSPIAVGDYFLTASNSRRLYCYDAPSGKVLWNEKGIGRAHASPVTAAGLVYFLGDDGITHVVKPGPKFELVAKNELGEKTYASPAISDGQIFLRSFKHLYCVGGIRD